MSKREVRLSVDVAPSVPFAYKITAECDDEQTTWILLGREYAVLGRRELSGDFGRGFVEDHLARCEACNAAGPLGEFEWQHHG